MALPASLDTTVAAGRLAEEISNATVAARIPVHLLTRYAAFEIFIRLLVLLSLAACNASVGRRYYCDGFDLSGTACTSSAGGSGLLQSLQGLALSQKMCGFIGCFISMGLDWRNWVGAG